MPAQTLLPPHAAPAPPIGSAGKRRARPDHLLVLLLALLPALAHAYVVTITSTTKSLYLQVGQGAITGGSRVSSGATPANNFTVNIVSVTVPAANLGTGTLPMTPNAAVTTSYIDNASYCQATDTYIGGMYRGPNGGASSATLTVATDAAGLVNAAGDSISFNSISWLTQSRSGDNAGNVMASGGFAGNGTTQSVWSIARNTWAESCLQFNYANTQVFSAGTYNGRVTYTLSAP